MVEKMEELIFNAAIGNIKFIKAQEWVLTSTTDAAPQPITPWADIAAAVCRNRLKDHNLAGGRVADGRRQESGGGEQHDKLTHYKFLQMHARRCLRHRAGLTAVREWRKRSPPRKAGTPIAAGKNAASSNA